MGGVSLMPYSETRKRFYPTFREEPWRFWAKVERRGGDECWLWLGACDSAGYGRTTKAAIPAHRLAWELTFGEDPGDLFVCHHCDNPPCCNPAHLFLGTSGDNSRDSVAKGRHFTPVVPRDSRGRFAGTA